MTSVGPRERFGHLVTEYEPLMRHAFIAAVGVDAGRQATTISMSWAWANIESIDSADAALPRIFKIGLDSIPAELRENATAADLGALSDETLAIALASLTMEERIASMAVHGHRHQSAKVGLLLPPPDEDVDALAEQGLDKLRRMLVNDRMGEPEEWLVDRAIRINELGPIDIDSAIVQGATWRHERNVYANRLWVLTSVLLAIVVIALLIR